MSEDRERGETPESADDVQRAARAEQPRLAKVRAEIDFLRDSIAECRIDPDAELARLQHLMRGAANYEDLRVLGESFDFPIYRADELQAAVASEPPMAWLIRGLIIAGTYGALSAAQKAKKSFTALEMGVCVAGGVPFFGHFEVDTCGPVVVLAGEGRKAMIERRLQAIAAHRGVEFATLPLYVVPRVPNLTVPEQLLVLDQQVNTIRPVLVILDPLYLAIPDVELSQLTKAAQPLYAIQRITERYGASLLVIHHWNKTGTGTGFDRSSGVGLQEWGRFLISLSADRQPDPEHERGEVTSMSFELIGENGSYDFVARNRIWSEDPDDLQSTLHYESELLDQDAAKAAKAAREEQEKEVSQCLKATTRAFAAVVAVDRWVTAGEVQHYDADHQPLKLNGDRAGPLQTDSFSKALKSLADEGLIRRDNAGVGRAIRFAPLTLEGHTTNDDPGEFPF